MIPAPAPEVVELEAALEAKRTGSAPLAWEPLADFKKRAAALPETTWLIHQLVQSEGRHLLVAEPNAGKTWALLLVAKAAAAEGRAVFMVLEEGGPKPTAGRFTALGIPADALISIAHLRGVTLQKDIESLKAAVRDHEAPVVLLDPWVSVSGDAEENDATEQKAITELCNALMRANPRTLLGVAHHANKSGAAGDGSRMMASRGSSALPGWADVMLYLEHVPAPKPGLVVFDAEVTKMRDGERGAVLRVCIELGTGLVTYTPREQVRAAEKAEERSAATEQLERQVIEALTGRAASGADLARQLNKNKARVLTTLKALASRGDIERLNDKWRLTVPEPVPAVPEPRIDRFHGSHTLEGVEPEPIPDTEGADA